MGMETGSDSGDTLWMIQQDTTLMDVNPAELSLLASEIWVRIKENPTPATFGCGDVYQFSPGMNLSLTTGAPLAVNGFEGLPSTPSLSQEQFNAKFALPLGSLRLGVTGMFTNVFEKNTGTTATSNGILVWGLGGGAYYDLTKDMSLEGAIDAKFWNIDRDSGGNSAYDAHTADLGLFSRFNWKALPGNNLHIALTYGFKDRSVTVGTAALDVNQIHTATLGFSDEVSLSEKTFLYIGAQGYYAQTVNPEDGESRSLKVKLSGGMESAFTDFLVIRFGANRLFYNYNEDAAAQTQTNTEDGTNVAVGAGLTIGELLFDIDLNTKILSEGPDFISGSAPGPWSLDLVVTYKLGGKDTSKSPGKP